MSEEVKFNRSIIHEDDENQEQQDDTGRVYIYRKDYVRAGDQKNEFSLVYMYSRKQR